VHHHDMTMMDLNPKRRIINKLFHPFPELKAKCHIVVWNSRMEESYPVQVNKVLRKEINLWLESSDKFFSFVTHFHLLDV